MSTQLQGTEDTVQLLLKCIELVESRTVAPSSVSLFRRDVAEAIANWTQENVGSEMPSDKISAIRVSCELLARHLLMAAPIAEKTEDLKRAARDAVKKLR